MLTIFCPVGLHKPSAESEQSELAWFSPHVEKLAVRPRVVVFHPPPPPTPIPAIADPVIVSLLQSTVFNNILIQDIILLVIPLDDIHLALFLVSKNFAMRLFPSSTKRFACRLNDSRTSLRPADEIMKSSSNSSRRNEMEDSSMKDSKWLVHTLQKRGISFDSVTTFVIHVR